MTMLLTTTTPNLPKFCNNEFMERVLDGDALELGAHAVAYENHDLYNVHSVYRDYGGLLSTWIGKKVWYITALIEVSSTLSFYVVSFENDGKSSDTGFLTRDELVNGFNQFRSIQVWDGDMHVEFEFGDF